MGPRGAGRPPRVPEDLLVVPPPTQKPAPPGSLGLPFIGETLSYIKENHRFFEERFERHGPVFKTRLFGQAIVCFAGPDAFEFFKGPFDVQQLSKPTYLGQIRQEVRRSRINCSTCLGQVEPFEYRGFQSPSGWKAVGCIHATRQDAEVFSRPERFDPDRLGPKRAEDRRHGYAYVRHGGGPTDGHRCPGEDLISVLMKAVAVLLLRRYRWELLPPNHGLETSPFPLPRDSPRVRLMPAETS